MSMRRYIGMMAALLGSTMAAGQGNAIEFRKRDDDTAVVPFNPSATWHPQSGRVSGAAKQRRASTKRRNIQRQKQHPNCRSAK